MYSIWKETFLWYHNFRPRDLDEKFWLTFDKITTWIFSHSGLHKLGGAGGISQSCYADNSSLASDLAWPWSCTYLGNIAFNFDVLDWLKTYPNCQRTWNFKEMICWIFWSRKVVKTVIGSMFSSANLRSLQRGDLSIKPKDITWASVMNEGSH